MTIVTDIKATTTYMEEQWLIENSRTGQVENIHYNRKQVLETDKICHAQPTQRLYY
jgi:hypothetical protein